MEPINLEGQTLRIVVDLVPPRLVIRLQGELDLACADLLKALDGVDFGGLQHVTVDLSGLSFCDSSGLDSLLGFRSLTVAGGREIELVHASPLLRKICSILGEEHVLAA